jgi:hypothetical protein
VRAFGFSNFTGVVHKFFRNSASINLSFAEICVAMGLVVTSFLESLPVVIKNLG